MCCNAYAFQCVRCRMTVFADLVPEHYTQYRLREQVRARLCSGCYTVREMERTYDDLAD